MDCGALDFLEWRSEYAKYFGKKTEYLGINDEVKQDKHNLFHPYVFFGIRGLPPGLAFESLRSN